MRFLKTFFLFLGAFLCLGAILYFRNGSESPETEDPAKAPQPKEPVAAVKAPPPPAGQERATFGGGCFWCTEAVFQQLKGVGSVVSGYSGGTVKNPTYKQICTGTTGHAEVIQVTFDPAAVSYEDLLEVFWRTHDPTTRNRQGNDAGPQYRSVIFYHSDEQRSAAEHYKKKLDEAGIFARPIVTEIASFEVFYPAEDYHQNYYADNSTKPYCQAIIKPKLDKMKKVFQEKLKSGSTGK